MMKPDGSLSPGMMNLAMTPATKPMMIVHRIPIRVTPSVEERYFFAGSQIVAAFVEPGLVRQGCNIR